jgi:cell division protein FtsB
MRKEELERRCAEMKARMLAQRAERVIEELPKAAARKTATRRKRSLSAPASEAPQDEVAALKAQVSRLEAENRKLRQQLDAIGSRSVVVAPPSRSGDDEAREQRHNYFKYSNARRW